MVGCTTRNPQVCLKEFQKKFAVSENVCKRNDLQDLVDFTGPTFRLETTSIHQGLNKFRKNQSQKDEK